MSVTQRLHHAAGFLSITMLVTTTCAAAAERSSLPLPDGAVDNAGKAAAVAALDGLVHRGTGIARHGSAAPVAALRSGPGTAAGTPSAGATADLVIANGYRAYPPSCLSDPLPYNIASGTPVYTYRNLRLAAHNADDPAKVYYEDVDVTIWRVACSSSGNLYNSATLLGIDRASSNNGDGRYYPLFPGLKVSQGNSTYKLVRVAAEPNTVISHVYPDTPIINSATWVLENFPSTSSATARFDFNEPFTIYFENYIAGSPVQGISVPGYAPTPGTFPDAYKDLPITGHMSGNWYNPAHDGEGMNIEIGELAPNQRYLAFAWYTYDALGLPYWISGSALLSPADGTTPPTRTITATAGYRGGFRQHDQHRRVGHRDVQLPGLQPSAHELSGEVGLAAEHTGPCIRRQRYRWPAELAAPDFHQRPGLRMTT